MTDWSNIVRQHGPLVWKTAYRLLSNDADASDCFQDAFVSALELSRKEAIRHWPATLKRLTTARALEQLRRRYRHASRNEALPDMPLVDNQASKPSQGVADAEIVDQLHVALSRIDAIQAEVFCLSVFDELSNREVADQLDLKANHVGVLLHRAKKNLQDLLEGQSESTADVRSDENRQRTVRSREETQ
ncbi:MAG: sigma-70 family RNA polymerase sigma factor [Pirellulaceae bacterium]